MSIKLSSIINEILENSSAGEEAKKLGLVHKGWGRYADPKSGEVTHQSKGGKLEPVAKRTNNNQQKSSNPRNQGSTQLNPNSYEDDPNLDRQSNLINKFGFSPYDRQNVERLAKNGLIPLNKKGHGIKRWRRGDGSSYKDWGVISPYTDWNKTSPAYDAMQKNPNIKRDTLDAFVKSIVDDGAKHIGTVSGEFGSSGSFPAYRHGKDIYVDKGSHIEYGSVSRLKNMSVWRNQK